MKQKFFGILTVVAVFSVVCLTGCKSDEEFRRERAESAMKHFERSRFKQVIDGKKLSLSECIAFAQKNNLEIKTEELEKQVVREQKTAEMLGMLPDLNLKNTYTSRNNTAASSSKKIGSGGLTYGYSSSSDDSQNVFTTELALSTLDFGLAYYNTVQATDREMMKNQQIRRVSQNLTLDVVKAYFKVAAAQRAIKITRKLLADCRGNYQLQ